MALGDWANSYRLEIDNANVDATQTDFPVYLNLSTTSGTTSVDVSAIFTELGASSKKIAVFQSDQTTECYVEIERWDNAGSKAELWVKVPSVSSSAKTVIYFAYDSAKADNTTYIGTVGETPAQNVWDSNFVAVYHMAQDPTGGSGAIKDSTSNGYNGTPGGTFTSGDLIDGAIGKAIVFDASDDYIALGTFDPGGTALTFELNHKFPTDGGAISCLPLCKRDTWADNDMRWQINMLNRKYYFNNPLNNTANEMFTEYTIADNVDINFSLTWASGGSMYLYIDGVLESTRTAPALATDTAAAITVGDDPGGGKNADFQVAELRISNTARSGAWLKATYYSNTDAIVEWVPLTVTGTTTGTGSLTATGNMVIGSTVASTTATSSLSSTANLVYGSTVGATSATGSMTATAHYVWGAVGTVLATGSLAGIAETYTTLDVIKFDGYINQAFQRDGQICQNYSKIMYIDQAKNFILEK